MLISQVSRGSQERRRLVRVARSSQHDEEPRRLRQQILKTKAISPPARADEVALVPFPPHGKREMLVG